MLRNVLADYLDRVSERDFDIPFMLLLSSMGFMDVHFVHGSVEFGKDFIAKKKHRGKLIQYAFQSKSGNITLRSWRNAIHSQLLSSVTNRLSHPNYDRSLSSMSVLVATGDLTGNARIEFDTLADSVKNNFRRQQVAFWGKPQLLDMLAEYASDSLFPQTATGFAEVGNWYLVYGKSLRGELGHRDIEHHSRNWLVKHGDLISHLLRCTLEAEVMSQQTMRHNRVYESIHSQLCLARMICVLSFTESLTDLDTYYMSIISRVNQICVSWLTEIHSQWQQHEDLLRIQFMDMTTYLVQCQRMLDIIGIAYFTTNNAETKAWLSQFLREMVARESGCTRPPSDRYAVSIVLATLVLHTSGQTAEAKEFMRDVTIWLCDRYESGIGLASIEADETEETEMLLGYPFDFIGSNQPSGSLLSTAIGDLAAYFGDTALYGSIINDIKACDIHPAYWQAVDSAGACRFESNDVIQYPNVAFADSLAIPPTDAYAEHMPTERMSFQFSDRFGVDSAVVVMAVLRDRYFPKLWSRLAPQQTDSKSVSEKVIFVTV